MRFDVRHLGRSSKRDIDRTVIGKQGIVGVHWHQRMTVNVSCHQCQVEVDEVMRIDCKGQKDNSETWPDEF